MEDSEILIGDDIYGSVAGLLAKARRARVRNKGTQADPENYSSNPGQAMLRSVVPMMARWSTTWTCMVLDISLGFLNAPLDKGYKRPILYKLGLSQEAWFGGH